TERRLRLFPRLEQGLFRPLRDRRLIGSNAVEAFEYRPYAGSGYGYGFLNILNRLVHSALAFLHSGVRTVPAVPAKREPAYSRLHPPRNLPAKSRSFNAWNGSD